MRLLQVAAAIAVILELILWWQLPEEKWRRFVQAVKLHDTNTLEKMFRSTNASVSVAPFPNGESKSRQCVRIAFPGSTRFLEYSADDGVITDSVAQYVDLGNQVMFGTLCPQRRGISDVILGRLVVTYGIADAEVEPTGFVFFAWKSVSLQ